MGLLFDRGLDGGEGQVSDTNIPLDGSSTHVTQWNPSGTRYSWDANGSDVNSADNQHYTNSQVPTGSPQRHNPNA